MHLFKLFFQSEEPLPSDARERLRSLGWQLTRLKPLPAITAGLAAAAGACIAASLFVHPNWNGVLGAALSIIMIWIAATDARRFRIPNSAVLAALGLGLLHTATDQFGSLVVNISFAVVRGATLALMFAGLRNGYRVLRGREGLGLGDVKLAFVAGVWLDWDIMAIAVAVASLSGLVFYGCHQLLTGRRVRAVSRVPFGLYFAPTIWLGWLFDSTRLAAL